MIWFFDDLTLWRDEGCPRGSHNTPTRLRLLVVSALFGDRLQEKDIVNRQIVF
ncbi:MAG: hypothetical protein ABR533_10200 [Desulfonatronovibrio sp.]|nr:hypothetical protein [Desulfovibrionales bacterium]